MKKNIFLLATLVVLGLSTSCNSKEKEKSNSDSTSTASVETEVQSNKPEYSFINPFDNYFAVNKVKSNTELSLDSIQFTKEFQFAATMNNSPMNINFQKEKVGAIVLPETAYETTIVLDTNFVKNDTLHVVYTINQGKDANTFTTIPVQLFTYNSKFHLIFEKK